MSSARLQRNLPAYTIFIAARECWCWAPTVLLYLSARVGLDDAIGLQALYYAAVVALEVPSGYAADRFGRRPTLLISALALLVAYVTFACADSTAALVAAQVALAAGVAFSSGADTSLLYDTLHALGRAHSYGPTEARLLTIGSVAIGIGAVAGGALGCIDLRLTWALSAATAAVMVVAAALLREPPRSEAAEPLLPQLRASARALAAPALAWPVGVALAAIAINHIPWELHQGWFAAALPALLPAHAELTPLVTGLHVTAAALVAALATPLALPLARRLGAPVHLTASLLLQVLLVGAMAASLHPAIALVILARGVPEALQQAPLRQTITPALPARLRATALSLVSLGGRLATALLLGVVTLSGSTLLGATSDIQARLLAALGVAATLTLLLVIAAPRARRA